MGYPLEASLYVETQERQVVEGRVRTFRGQGHTLPSVSLTSVSSLRSSSVVVVDLQYCCLV